MDGHHHSIERFCFAVLAKISLLPFRATTVFICRQLRVEPVKRSFPPFQLQEPKSTDFITTMTTTDVFQGMSSDAKSSSRVLRPPGGGSSNIFGTDSGDDRPQQRRQQPATSNLFGAEDDTKDKVGKRQGGPPDNSRDNVFGGSMVQDNTLKENKRRGQGDEFPVYDRSVYAANLTPQRRNKAQVSTYNPITGEDTPGHMAEEPQRRRGKRGQQTSSLSDEGMYNPITGQPYSSEDEGKKEEDAQRKEEEEQKEKQQQQQQQQHAEGEGGKALPVYTSSRVLNPPGGKSSGLW